MLDQHQPLREMVALHSLDALEPQEAREVEEHLRSCQECRDELDGLREVTAMLASASEVRDVPPMGAKLLAAIASTQQEGVFERALPAQRGRAWKRALGAGVLTLAASVAAITGFGEPAGLERTPRPDTFAAVAAQPGTKVAALTSLDGHTAGRALVGTRVVAVAFNNLDPNTGLYVLWAEDFKGQMRALKGFKAQPGVTDVVVRLDTSAVRAVALSVEKGPNLPVKPSYAVARAVVTDA